MSQVKRIQETVLIALLLLSAVALAVPAAAFALEPAPTSVGDDATAERVAEDPAAPLPEPTEGIAPIPEDFLPVTTGGPTDTRPPKLDSAQFGVGWPAAVAVGVALLAVLTMALVWRRDEVR